MSLIFAVIIIVLLLMISAFFSAAETAMTAASKAKLHAMEKNAVRGAKQVRALVNNPDKLLSTILLGNNLVNIGASALATSLLLSLFGDTGVVYATLVMTGLILIFAEVLPKTIAAQSPEKVAIDLAIPMQLIVWTLRPATRLIRLLVRGIFWAMGLKHRFQPHYSVDDLRGAIGLGQEHGILDDSERHMLESVLELDTLTVTDLMQHRSKIISLNVSDTPEALFKQVVASSFSRFPVWKVDRDTIVGTLHAKDFYAAYATHLAQGTPFNLHDIMQPPYFIPSTVLVTKQLIEFKTQRTHMGLVVDEYGDIQGVITLEDILEEIVGEIEDEHDMAHPTAHPEADGSVVLTASMPIRDVNRLMDWRLPDNDHVTLGGLITATHGKGLPPEGTRLMVAGITFEVVTKRKNALLKLRAFPRLPLKVPPRG